MIRAALLLDGVRRATALPSLNRASITLLYIVRYYVTRPPRVLYTGRTRRWLLYVAFALHVLVLSVKMYYEYY